MNIRNYFFELVAREPEIRSCVTYSDLEGQTIIKDDPGRGVDYTFGKVRQYSANVGRELGEAERFVEAVFLGHDDKFLFLRIELDTEQEERFAVFGSGPRVDLANLVEKLMRDAIEKCRTDADAAEIARLQTATVSAPGTSTAPSADPAALLQPPTGLKVHRSQEPTWRGKPRRDFLVWQPNGNPAETTYEVHISFSGSYEKSRAAALADEEPVDIGGIVDNYLEREFPKHQNNLTATYMVRAGKDGQFSAYSVPVDCD